MKVGKKSSRRKGNKRRIEGKKRQWLVAIGAAGAVIGYTIGPDRHLHKRSPRIFQCNFKRGFD